MIQKWQKFIQQQQASKTTSPQQIQAMQEQMQKLQQENQQLKTDQTNEQMELQLRKQKQDAELSMKQQEIEAKLKLEQMDIQGKLAIQQQAQNHDMQLQTHRTQGDLKIKAAAAGIEPSKQGDIAMKIDTTDIADTLSDITKQFAASLAAVVQAINEPKQIVRDANGRPIGVKPVPRIVQ